MRTDGRTDMTKLIVAFCNFTKAPKKRRRKQKLNGKKPMGGGSWYVYLGNLKVNPMEAVCVFESINSGHAP
jgi:hypothetical protein